MHRRLTLPLALVAAGCGSPPAEEKTTAVLETRAVSGTERFMAIPGQALAYKIGQLKILELRRRAEAALGDDFDIRAFHAKVLEEGDLPLDILEARIDAWLAGETGN